MARVYLHKYNWSNPSSSILYIIYIYDVVTLYCFVVVVALLFCRGHGIMQPSWFLTTSPKIGIGFIYSIFFSVVCFISLLYILIFILSSLHTVALCTVFIWTWNIRTSLFSWSMGVIMFHIIMYVQTKIIIRMHLSIPCIKLCVLMDECVLSRYVGIISIK